MAALDVTVGGDEGPVGVADGRWRGAGGDLAHVGIEVRAGRALVHVSGEFDLATAHHLETALGTLANHGITQFTIDLAGVPFMDSAGLQPILNLLAAYPAPHVQVVGAQAEVRILLRAHRVDALLSGT